jgi:thymidylate kinase
MIVEFIGCTNSGKSTIATRVAEKLKNLGLTVILVDVGGDIKMDFITLPRFVYFAIHNFTFCRFVVRIIAREVDSLVIGLNVFRNFAKKVGMYELLKKKKKDLIILSDEGTLHAAHNLFVHINSPPRLTDVTRFACLVSKPDMIVYVKTSSEIAMERTFKRGHRRVKHTLKDVKLFVEHAYKTFEILTSIAGIQNRLIVVNNFVNGTEEIENMADIVVKGIIAQDNEFNISGSQRIYGR